MIPIYPDLDWYRNQAEKHGLPVRCPFANVHSCPRHFQSVALLGSEGLTSKLPVKQYNELSAKWTSSHLWPVIDEHATAIINSNCFSRFCPEVSFDVFQLFASSLIRYADEIDRDLAHKAIERDGGRELDWRWGWSHVTAMHYADCPLFAQLKNVSVQQLPTVKSDDILTMKPGAFGVTIDVRKLITKLARWWIARNEK